MKPESNHAHLDKPQNRQLAYLTWKQVEAINKRRTHLIVLPTAAIEQHGHHLPLATDTLINNLLLGQALANTCPPTPPSIRCRPLCYGKSNEHHRLPRHHVALRLYLHGRPPRPRRQPSRLRLQPKAGASTTPTAAIPGALTTSWPATSAPSSACAPSSSPAPPVPSSPEINPQERRLRLPRQRVRNRASSSPPRPSSSTPVSTPPTYIADVNTIPARSLKPEFAPATFSWLTRDIAPFGRHGRPTPRDRRKRPPNGSKPPSFKIAECPHRHAQLPRVRPRPASHLGRRRNLDPKRTLDRLRQRRHASSVASPSACPTAPPSSGRSLLPAYAGPDGKSGDQNPTLLMRQPYGRDIASTVVYAHPIWFARHGYNVVIQDVRGRGDSEGTFYPFRHEARDGASTPSPLLSQSAPNANGRIRHVRLLLPGHDAVARRPPNSPKASLCIAPAQTAHDLYHGWFYCGWRPEGLPAPSAGASRCSKKTPAAKASTRASALARTRLGKTCPRNILKLHTAVTLPYSANYVLPTYARTTDSIKRTRRETSIGPHLDISEQACTED